MPRNKNIDHTIALRAKELALNFVSLVSFLYLKCVCVYIYIYIHAYIHLGLDLLPQSGVLEPRVSYAIFWDTGYVESLASYDLLGHEGTMRCI